MYLLGAMSFLLGGILASINSASMDPLSYFLNFGILGIFFILVGTGKVFVTRRELDEARTQRDLATARAEKAEDSKEDQNKYMQEKVIPLLTETTRTLVEVGRNLQISPSPQQNAVELKLQQGLEEISKTLRELKR